MSGNLLYRCSLKQRANSSECIPPISTTTTWPKTCSWPMTSRIHDSMSSERSIHFHFFPWKIVNLQLKETNPDFKRNTVMELLIRPVQRLPSVILLMKEINKKSDKSGQVKAEAAATTVDRVLK